MIVDNFSPSQGGERQKTVVCLPTFNERDNLLPFVSQLRKVVPAAQILIVDDNSPDGTGQLAEEIAGQDDAVSVLHRPGKEGLGRAYQAGFRYALEQFSASIIVQMDCDFSHPLSMLPTLLEGVGEADLVVGSRYVAGGGTRNWSLWRQLLSRSGSFYARIWLGLPYRDLTSGFKVWRGELLQRVLTYPIAAGGYSFQVEMTFLAAKLGARIVEVPFVFHERREGNSKMSMAIALEALWKVPLLRFSCPRPRKEA